ncbi:restriction endonuclease subunit S [Streptomyces olivaceus]|uniref:restriction endonuclease subunit S n=1 Tax=Streptomyces olivaceus TaxID=47716 RepID=UPI0014700AED|nr:restriction endonuclease subunit S [Streptomyces olivaceus]MBZ6103178.1 restriction endonuclease subunit S [Streptomyces olivaceus]
MEDLLACEPRAITDGPFGSNLKSAHYTDSGARVLRLQNIGDGQFRDERAYINLAHFESLRAHEAAEGDLLLASLGETLPRVAILPKLDEPAIVKADVIRARLHPAVVTKWVYYALRAPQTQVRTSALIKGVGRPRLGLAAMRSIPVPVPPLAEQWRIVEMLEEQLSRLDAAVVSVEASSRRVRGLRAAALSAALESVGDSPVRRLADVLKEPLRNGHSAKATTDPGGIRTLNLTAVTQGDFSDENTKLTVADPHRVRDLWLTRGDILVQRSNTPDLVGTAAMYAGDNGWAIFPDLLIRVRVCEGVLPEYATLVLQSRDGRSYFKSRAKGLAGSMPKIDQSAIENFRIPVPSLDAQKRVVAEVQEQFDRVSRLSAELDRARKRSDGLRRALLRTAFNGCLVPQDSKDEPAPRLLARIAAERAAQPKPKRARKTAAKPPAQRVADVTAPEPTTAPALAVQQEFEL